MLLRGGGDIQLLRCGDVEANPGPDPEPSTSRPSASLRETRISTPRKSSQSAKDPSLSEVMAMLNSINSFLNSKMDGMNASLNDKMDGVKEDVGQLHQEFSTLSELKASEGMEGQSMECKANDHPSPDMEESEDVFEDY
ncbi:hypothetical protein ACOMHN_047760 [Nucella lapillus]